MTDDLNKLLVEVQEFIVDRKHFLMGCKHPEPAHLIYSKTIAEDQDMSYFDPLHDLLVEFVIGLGFEKCRIDILSDHFGIFGASKLKIVIDVLHSVDDESLFAGSKAVHKSVYIRSKNG